MILSICDNPSVLGVFRLVRIVILIIKIAVPIALIISCMIDFAKDVANDKGDFHETSNLVVKKIIAAVLVFMIPTMIGIIANINGFDKNSYLSCLENATSENIAKLQVTYSKKLLSDLKDNYSNGQYSGVKAEINKIEDEETKKELLKELEDLKTENENKKNASTDSNTNTSTNTNSNSNGQPSNASNNDKINSYVQEAYKIANDDSHGYNNNAGSNLFNPDVDCGTFVSFSLQHAGIIPSGNYMNPNDPLIAITLLEPYGFSIYPFDINNLQYGDILIKYGHTEIYVGNNTKIGAHWNNGHPEAGDQDGTEVSANGLNTDWTNIIRLDH